MSESRMSSSRPSAANIAPAPNDRHGYDSPFRPIWTAAPGFHGLVRGFTVVLRSGGGLRDESRRSAARIDRQNLRRVRRSDLARIDARRPGCRLACRRGDHHRCGDPDRNRAADGRAARPYQDADRRGRRRAPAGRNRQSARRQRTMTTSGRLAAMGTSPRAIMHHYDLSDDFFRIWLGPEMVYSCGWWDAAAGAGSLARAQHRKLDFFADRLGVRGRRVLDVGCGWGALLDRVVRVRGAASGLGLTLSPGQAQFAAGRNVRAVSYQQRNWIDHDPSEPYDAITCVEAAEHFASDILSADEKVEVYRAFFERAASWLRPGGRMGLQLICLDNVGHTGSRAGRGPFADPILHDIFPESMPASLSELVLGCETHFELDEFLDHPVHYQRTFRAWTLAFREEQARAAALVGPDVCRTYARYFAAGEAAFRLREHSLYRVILTKRPEPKRWAVTVRPSDIQ